MRLRITLGGAAIRTTTIKAARLQEIHGGTPEISTPRIHGGSGAVEARQLKALVDGGSAATMTRSGERNCSITGANYNVLQGHVTSGQSLWMLCSSQ